MPIQVTRPRLIVAVAFVLIALALLLGVVAAPPPAEVGAAVRETGPPSGPSLLVSEFSDSRSQLWLIDPLRPERARCVPGRRSRAGLGAARGGLARRGDPGLRSAQAGAARRRDGGVVVAERRQRAGAAGRWGGSGWGRGVVGRWRVDSGAADDGRGRRSTRVRGGGGGSGNGARGDTSNRGRRRRGARGGARGRRVAVGGADDAQRQPTLEPGGSGR